MLKSINWNRLSSSLYVIKKLINWIRLGKLHDNKIYIHRFGNLYWSKRDNCYHINERTLRNRHGECPIYANKNANSVNLNWRSLMIS